MKRSFLLALTSYAAATAAEAKSAYAIAQELLHNESPSKTIYQINDSNGLPTRIKFSLSPSGKYAVGWETTGSDRNTIIFFLNLKTKVTDRLYWVGGLYGVEDIVYAPNGRLAISWDVPDTFLSIKLINEDSLQGPMLRSNVYSEISPLLAKRFSRDGTLLLGCTEHDAEVWDCDSAKTVQHYAFPDEKLNDTDMTFDGKVVATATDKGLTLWHTKRRTKKILSRIPYKKVLFSPDGKILVAIAQTAITQIWNVATGSIITELIGGPRPSAIALLPRHDKILMQYEDGTLKVYDHQLAGQIVKDARLLLGSRTGLLTLDDLDMVLLPAARDTENYVVYKVSPQGLTRIAEIRHVGFDTIVNQEESGRISLVSQGTTISSTDITANIIGAYFSDKGLPRAQQALIVTLDALGQEHGHQTLRRADLALFSRMPSTIKNALRAYYTIATGLRDKLRYRESSRT